MGDSEVVMGESSYHGTLECLSEKVVTMGDSMILQEDRVLMGESRVLRGKE